MKNSRRNFLKIASIAGAGIAGPSLSIASHRVAPDMTGGISLDEKAPLTALNRFPRMVHEYFVQRMRKAEEEANKKRAALRTKKDAQNYVAEVQKKIQDCFGPWPEKSPLNARVTGILERDGYRIEKVIFDSRPDFPVTANLYMPVGKKMPLPAVVGTCGHNANGKAAIPYQSFAQGLAKKGYIVLLFDPIGQGERLQFVDQELKPLHGIGVPEHLYASNQMILAGESLSSWFAWDGIRAVDYLLSRPEVDSKHIGVTGNSGGGTQATWLCGVERRFTMAAPSCFVVTFRHNLENELPADSEQYPLRAIALGLDHTDFIAAMAPKPVILLGQEKDYFDIRGLEESYSRLKNLYKLLGEEQNIQLFIGPEYHGYSQHNREAMYGWFNRVTGISSDDTEPALNIEKDEDLWCTPHGQAGEFKPVTTFSFVRNLSRKLSQVRGVVRGDALREKATNLLKLHPWKHIPHFRIQRPLPNRLYPKNHAISYLVETEPNIQIPVYRLADDPLYSQPPKDYKRAVLYVSHHSADNEMRHEDFLQEIIRNESGSAIFACDVRGIGESRPNTCGNDFLAPYGNDYFYAGHSLMFDHPYPGQKTFDILMIINWLQSYGHEEIHLVAKGWGTVPAVFAALLSEAVSQVTLKNALTSYSNIAENQEYSWPLSAMIPGILKQFDLSDCYEALKAKNLRQIDPWDEMAGQNAN